VATFPHRLAGVPTRHEGGGRTLRRVKRFCKTDRRKGIKEEKRIRSSAEQKGEGRKKVNILIEAFKQCGDAPLQKGRRTEGSSLSAKP